MEAKLKNNKGIAMITVLLITVILGILTVVALHELGYDVINAGQNTTTEYARNISNSATSIILPAIGAGGTLGGITINPMDSDSIIIGDYYYTTANSSILNNNGTTYLNLNASNLLSTSVSQSILGNTQSGEQIGFEYEVTTCWEYQTGEPPVTQYYYYTGFINVISRDNANSKLVETGANFTYGTFTAAQLPSSPNNCNDATPTTNPA